MRKFKIKVSIRKFQKNQLFKIIWINSIIFFKLSSLLDLILYIFLLLFFTFFWIHTNGFLTFEFYERWNVCWLLFGNFFLSILVNDCFFSRQLARTLVADYISTFRHNWNLLFIWYRFSIVFYNRCSFQSNDSYLLVQVEIYSSFSVLSSLSSYGIKVPMILCINSFLCSWDYLRSRKFTIKLGFSLANSHTYLMPDSG